MAISLEVLFFEKNSVCFQKWSRLRIVPFPSVCRAWHEKWSCESGLKFLAFGVTPYQNKNRNRSMDEVQNLGKKEGKYSKILAKLQVTAVFLKRDIRITFLNQIRLLRFLWRRAPRWCLELSTSCSNFKKGSSQFLSKLPKKVIDFLLKHCEIWN